MEGIFVTLTILKRDYELQEASDFFLLPNWQCISRIYVTYLAFMQDFFADEFPVPNKEQILTSTPEQLFTAFAINTQSGDDGLTMEYLPAICDCMGRALEKTSDPEIQRAIRDHYRNQCGVLLAVFMLPNGTVSTGWSSQALCGNDSDKNTVDKTTVASRLPPVL